MSRLSVPSLEPAIGATAELYAQIRKAAGKVSNAYATKLVNPLARSGLLREDLDYHLLRASMVIIFLFFGYQKWFAYEAQVLIPYISNGPLISWMYPVFGIRGASWFLGAAEWLFGALLFLGFWNKKLGILGALGSVVTFVMTVTIIPFMPNGWDPAAGFPAMAGNVPFLMKDVVLLAVSIYLLKQDVLRVTLPAQRGADTAALPISQPIELAPEQSSQLCSGNSGVDFSERSPGSHLRLRAEAGAPNSSNLYRNAAQESQDPWRPIVQSLNRRFLLIGALGAIAQLHPAAALATQPEKASDIIAAQLRRQGVACTTPRNAVRDPDNSRPHETVWTLRCDEASYRVTLVPRLGARITPICREVSESAYGPQRLGET